MAKIKNPWEGGSGICGPLVLFQRNGRSYIRMKPKMYHDLKSPEQEAQRLRMKVMNNFLNPFAPLIRITFQKEKPGRTAFQEAQSYNMRNALAGEYPDIYVDRRKALLSKGPLPLPVSFTVAAHPEGLLFTWQNGYEAQGNSEQNTLVVMALFNDTGTSRYKLTDTVRTEGEYLWKLKDEITEDSLPDVWIAFRDNFSTLMSNSVKVDD